MWRDKLEVLDGSVVVVGVILVINTYLIVELSIRRGLDARCNN